MHAVEADGGLDDVADTSVLETRQIVKRGSDVDGDRGQHFACVPEKGQITGIEIRFAARFKGYRNIVQTDYAHGVLYQKDISPERHGDDKGNEKIAELFDKPDADAALFAVLLTACRAVRRTVLRISPGGLFGFRSHFLRLEQTGKLQLYLIKNGVFRLVFLITDSFFHLL